MRIDMNPVGNYSQINFRNVNRQSKPAEVIAQAAAQKTELPKQAALTPDEKTFFANMYPANKSEIVDYHFYEKDGKLSGVQIGSLFDKRG